MKKIVIVLFALLIMLSAMAIAEEDPYWSDAPVIKKAYEQSAGKFYLEWEGYAPVYQVYLDGEKVADVIVNHYVISMEKGAHKIIIYPINEVREADTKVDLELNANVIGGGISIDLASLGLDPKHLYAGNPSETLSVDYKPSQITNSTPEGLSAYTDPQDRVVLSFEDQYNADEYLVTVKRKNDVNYLTYRMSNDTDKALVTKLNSNVSLILDQEFLRAQDCMIPELNEEYKFTVQLRKYGISLLESDNSERAILESKVSGEYTYRVTATWKIAPVITFASQTADGQITLEWEHDDYGIGCEYAVMKINKVLGVMTGEEQLGLTKDHSFTAADLTNGGYCINIVPIYNNEKGTYSADANVDVKNEWVVAPELKCEQLDGKRIRLTWKALANIEKYHITVYTGDNNSILRFVDLDYSKYAEYDLDATEGDMEFVYEYDKDIDPENGIKMKFEIYALRYAGNGSEQRSAVSSQSLVLK